MLFSTPMLSPVGPPQQRQSHLTGTHSSHLKPPLQREAVTLRCRQQTFVQFVGNTGHDEAGVCLRDRPDQEYL